MALIHQYEVTDSENNFIVLANQDILLHPQHGLFYKNEHTFSFANYNAGLQAVFE